MTAPQVVTASRERGGDDGLTHVTSLGNDDLALCGVDVTGCEWDLDGDGMVCVVCLDEEARLRAWGYRRGCSCGEADYGTPGHDGGRDI